MSGLLVPRPVKAVNVSAAYLSRKVASEEGLAGPVNVADVTVADITGYLTATCFFLVALAFEVEIGKPWSAG